MSDMSDAQCACCGEPLERVRYFPRQLLTADDMRAEQEYLREKARRHNRFLHGWGVVCGCLVEPVTTAKTPTVRVCPGYAVAPQGDEIWINQCVDVDLQTGPQDQPCAVQWPCPPMGGVPTVNSDGFATVYVAVRYAECYGRPVRVHPAGCGCDETGCEYSRVRDSFEIKVLWQLPNSYADAKQDEMTWCSTIKQVAGTLGRTHTYPVPPCPPCESDPWVVLATVMFYTGTDTKILSNPAKSLIISFADRRVLLPTQRLQTAVLCFA
jgi:hypothetical protein